MKSARRQKREIKSNRGKAKRYLLDQKGGNEKRQSGSYKKKGRKAGVGQAALNVRVKAAGTEVVNE